MTMREKMLCCYCGKQSDVRALGIYSRYLKRGNMERLARNGGMGIIDYVALTSQIGPPWHLIPEFLSEIRDTEVRVEYIWEHGRRIQRRKYITPVGTVYADVGVDVGDGSEHISHYYVQTLEDYRVMRYIVKNAVIRKNEELFRTRQKDLGEDGVVLGRVDRTPYQKLMLEIVGGERFLMDLYTDPEPVEELMDAMYRRLDEEMSMAMDSTAEVLWMPENVTVDMTPPYNLKKYHLAAYQKYSKWAHEAGKLIVAHFDGKVKPLHDALLNSGLDGLESLSNPSIGGDATYDELCRMFPNMALLPNFPASLAISKENALEEYIAHLKDTAAQYHRSLMLQVSEDLPAGTYQTTIPRIVAAMDV
jgi:hypothetical protein